MTATQILGFVGTVAERYEDLKMKSNVSVPANFLSSFSGAEVALLTHHETAGSHQLAAGLVILLASVGYAQTATTKQDRDTPDFRVQVWGYIMADFSTRVWDYFELRNELERGLPPLDRNR